MRIANEVETLYTCGPAGGGGAAKSAREVVAVVSHRCCRARLVSRIRAFRGKLRCCCASIAHARAGDKGNISNISVIAYDPNDYPLLER